METGSIADWIGSWGTILSLGFIYVQIREAKDEYSKQHTSRIKIEVVLSTGYKEVEGGGITPSGYNDLQIWAANISEAAGAYRYVGLCKKCDLEKVKDSAFYSQKLILNDYTFPFHKPMVEFKKYNEFETIQEKNISKIQTVKGEELIDFFFGDSKQEVPVYIMFVDALNKPIIRELKLRLNGNKISMVE